MGLTREMFNATYFFHYNHNLPRKPGDNDINVTRLWWVGQATIGATVFLRHFRLMALEGLDCILENNVGALIMDSHMW